MTYHYRTPPKEIEKPLRLPIAQVICSWDNNFVDVGYERLFQLILAANYMDIKPLLDLTCAKVADSLKNKTPEQIRKQFNIVNDFEPGEEERIRSENRFASADNF